MFKRWIGIVAFVACVLDLPGQVFAKSEWPTLHNDYQRSGYTDDVVRGPYERKWYWDFHDEMIATRVEAIVAEGKCFVGTFAGNMVALDVANGDVVWTFAATGPIGASPCYRNGRLFFGADEGFATGHLYCIDAADGSLIWKYNAGAGIWASPACDDRNVYFGDRAGIFHAISTRTGELFWTLKTGGMILTSASFSPSGNKIIFGSEDMHVYCVDPGGKLLWKSAKLAGLSMRDHAPTIWQGLAIVRTNPTDAFHTVLGRNGDLLKEIQLSLPKTDDDKVLLDKWNDLIMHPTPRRRQAEQNGIIDYLKKNRYDQCFYALRLNDGKEPWIAPVFFTVGLHNPPTPPTFNPHSGELYTFCRSALTYYLRGVRRYNAMGRINRETGRLNFYWPDRDNGRDWYPFAMIGDETQALSLMGDKLVCTHQGTLAWLDLKTLNVTTIWAGRDTYGGIFGPAAVPGGFDGAKKLAKEGYLTGLPNEWHGPDRSICAVAEHRLFWVVGSQVVCIAGPDIAKTESGGIQPPPVIKSKLPACVNGGNVSRGNGTFDADIEKRIITVRDLEKYIAEPDRVESMQTDSPVVQQIRARLDVEVLELIEGGPWAPFIVELGISGEEEHFRSTAQTMQIVSLALPHVSEPVKRKAVVWLDQLFEHGVPLKEPLHETKGKRRELYTLGPGMIEFAERQIRYQAGIEDLYGLWAYAHYAGRWNKVLEQTPEVRRICEGYLKEVFHFSHEGTNDEAEHLNGQVAGLLAGIRILDRAGDSAVIERAKRRLAEMVTERVHHERADHALIRPTKVASKGLHQAKVPRYVGLTPDVAAMLSDFAPEPFKANVRALMTGLPLWYQAFGERMIGGENYISAPHLARGLFVAGADGDVLDVEPLASKLDQPWCRADLYSIEKISAILRRDSNGKRKV
ncbi:MAG: PQQ-binding-like beta-propeller repeat protein [Sedimentisphaerales bacterium]|nr:PQQ-binding-like beta-propeller repeat protein [Sedimentisphaerales bacterium]